MDDELPIEPDDLPGGWASSIRVAWGADEFTIDFLRVDPFELRAFLVSRIIGSPNLLQALHEGVGRLWHDFVRQTMPPEVHGDDV